MQKLNQKGLSFGLILLVLVSVFAVGFAGYYVYTRIHNKYEIDYEMSHTSVPYGCKEKTKNYSQGDGFDSVATWHISFTCSNSPIAIYNAVKDSAISNGYKVERANEKYANNRNLCLSRSGYYSYWSFSTNEGTFNFDHSPLGPTIDLEIHSKKYFPCT